MIYLFIDESGFNESSLSMLSCVITDAPESLRHEINGLKEDVVHNQRYSRILGNFTENGFHHTENHHEIRAVFLELLSRLTFEAYICFVDDKETDNKGNALYDNIFRRLIYDRLADYRGHPITVCFEQRDSKVNRRLNELRTIVLDIDSQNKDFFDVRGGHVPVVFSAGKDEPCLAIADYVCGVFSAYYNKLNSGEVIKEPYEERNFDDLRGKIRLIHDHKNQKFYSRRNPFP